MRSVGILIFDDVEVLDFCGPFEVFSVARKPCEIDRDPALFTVFTIAESRRTVRSTGGLLIEPHFTLGDAPQYDILVVPGGMGTRRERLNSAIIAWIRQRGRGTEITASVCTGAFLLAEAGLLDGYRATTHWSTLEWMRGQYPAVEMVSGARYIDEGRIATAAGISAGIDMSLHLVARLEGRETAIWTARRMEYDWREV